MHPILMLQHLVSPREAICALAFAVWPGALGEFFLRGVAWCVLRCQVAFEIGFSRKGFLVVTGTNVAIEFRRSGF
jgi:hypothetical protein